MAQKKGGLGKGLNALFEDNAPTLSGSAETLPVSQLEPNRDQPRKEFDREALTELADSIAEIGVIQPIIVRAIPGGGYQIVAGERRWRASQLAGLTEVPVIIRDLSDREVDEIALVENLQREDLNPIEEAQGYSRLMNEYAMTQEQVSQRVGKARSTVANSVRLLELPDIVKEMLGSGKLTVGHARPLLALGDEEEISRIASLVNTRGLTVRDVERLIKKEKEKREQEKKQSPQKNTPERNHYLDELELAMTQELGRRVKIRESGEQKGVLEIDYYSLEELGAMAMRLSGQDSE